MTLLGNRNYFTFYLHICGPSTQTTNTHNQYVDVTFTHQHESLAYKIWRVSMDLASEYSTGRSTPFTSILFENWSVWGRTHHPLDPIRLTTSLVSTVSITQLSTSRIFISSCTHTTIYIYYINYIQSSSCLPTHPLRNHVNTEYGVCITAGNGWTLKTVPDMSRDFTCHTAMMIVRPVGHRVPGVGLDIRPPNSTSPP